MIFRNDTPFSAKFVGIRASDNEDMIGMILVNASYALSPDGRTWTIADEQFPISTDPVETPFGVFHGAVNPPAEGVDVCVLATLRRSRPIREAEVSVRVNSHVSRLHVVGDRVWCRSGRTLVPSAPRSFTEMPLSYQRAYGGGADHEGTKVPWPDNPMGVGYYLSEEAAVNNPLHNIEHAGQRGTPQWNVPVPVAGWAPYPYIWGLRVKRAYEMEGDKVRRVNRTLFNNAHPDMIVPTVAPGDIVSFDGLLDRSLDWQVPTAQLRIDAIVGTEHLTPTTRIDGLHLWVDQSRIVIKHRAVFSYPVRQYEPRRAVLSLS